MHKKIFIINPNVVIGSPAQERVDAFKQYFLSLGFYIIELNHPKTFFSYLSLLLKVIRGKPDYLFISMPPFRNWFLFILPCQKIILDIRDGWSIAMSSGYGGSVKPRPYQALIARLIESLALRKSYASVTVTPGLKEYLEGMSSKHIFLIRNGLSNERLLIAAKYPSKNALDMSLPERIFVCSGKFSEYGRKKVVRILEVINSRYGDRDCIIRLIGADYQQNFWIEELIRTHEKYSNLSIQFIDRVGIEELYKLLSQAFCGIAVIRDPSYDFGTKVFDYTAIGLPILDYFDDRNSFTKFFSSWLDTSFSPNNSDISQDRITVIKSSEISI
jgi:hypothetical protein